ncbi:MAG: TSUP family transporter, partial [Spirochaetota bacterium]
GTGISEISQPLLERGMNLKTKRANATAILVEAAGDWIITILNLHAGLILIDIIIFTVPGAIIGAQIGAYISKYLPDRLLKIVFSLAVLTVGSFYIVKGVQWAAAG